MKTKNYRLLDTAIITALHSNEPSARGVIWTPVERNDVLEAEALVRVGYAEETSEAATVKTAAVRKAEAGNVDLSVSGANDALLQPDGTYKNGNGIRVNQDGTEYIDDANDDKLLTILEGNVGDITDALDGLTPEQRTRLGELEAGEGGAARAGVAKAVAAYDAE